MGTVLQDAKYALRMLKKSPGFTAVAILALALGIGANTAMFSFVNAWVLHPLPFPESARLMMLLEQNTKTGGTSNVIEPANFYDYQREAQDFDQLSAISPTTFNLTGNGRPEAMKGARVSWNFFETLRTHPEQGRAFLAQEDQPGAA